MVEEKRNHRSGHYLRIEPEGLESLTRDKYVEEAFKKVGCWRFCEKLQGGHNQVIKEFATNFTRSNTKVVFLNLPISSEVVSAVMEIPRGEERWFKNFRFEMQPCKIFLKPEFIDTDLNKVVPRSYVKDAFSNLLYNIQRYFTCEGRYHKVYTYHFKLLLHFTGIISLDLAFFLFWSLAKMADKVQMKNQACETLYFIMVQSS